MRIRLTRRSVLRGLFGGAAVSLALPPLEAMFDANGLAYADGPPPTRFALWFWGNGIRRAQWLPTGTGTAWQPRSETEPLATPALKPYVSPVTGFEIKTATHPHHSGMTGILTGQRYHQLGTTRDTIVSTCAGPTIDQVVAQRLWDNPMTRGRFRSLEVGVCRFTGTDEGTTFQHLSHNGPNNVNAAEYEPRRLFNRLFGAEVIGSQVAAARRSVLDAVRGDLTALSQRVSAADRMRLAQHTESIRAIELRLAAGPSLQCSTPTTPAEGYPDQMGREQIAEKNRVMSDLVAMAMACDLTRVVSILFSPCGAGTVYWMAGAQNGLHQICHDERAGGAEPQPTVHGAIRFTMEQLAYFLNRLRETQEGAQNLLDATAVLATTELSEGFTHSNDEFPVIVAGRAGGRLRGGVHARSSSRENTTNVLLTMLRAMGDPRPSFGAGPGATSTVISSLLA
ncbi:MAG: DUF1552 domain-containing protein [Myxococcales bacterium]|nr:DUF1552 domain-containing protein [Myxococcales bacterium]